jgi:hypothetical protein
MLRSMSIDNLKEIGADIFITDDKNKKNVN